MVLIVDSSRTAHFVMCSTGPSRTARPTGSTLKDSGLCDGIRHPRLVRHMIPELLSLLLAHASHQFGIVTVEGLMNQDAIDRRPVRLTPWPPCGTKRIICVLAGHFGSLTSMKSESTCFPRRTDRLRGSSSCRAVMRQALMQLSRTAESRSALAATSASCSSPRNSSMSSRSNDRSHDRSPKSRALGTLSARRSRLSSLVYDSHHAARVSRRRSVLSGSITRRMPSRSRRRAPPPRAASRNSTRLLPARSDAWQIVSVMYSHLPWIASKIAPKILLDQYPG